MYVFFVIIIIVGLVISTVVNFVDVKKLPSEVVIIAMLLATIGTVGGAIQQFFPHLFAVANKSRSQLTSSNQANKKSLSHNGNISFPSIKLPSLDLFWIRLGITSFTLIPTGFVMGDLELVSSKATPVELLLLFIGLLLICVLNGILFVTVYFQDYESQQEVLSYAILGIALIPATMVILNTIQNGNSVVIAFFLFLLIVFCGWFVSVFSIPAWLRIISFLKFFLRIFGLNPSVNTLFWWFIGSYILLCLLSLFDLYRVFGNM